MMMQGVTEEVEDKVVTEQGAVDVPGIVCV